METLDDRRTTGAVAPRRAGVLFVFSGGLPTFAWEPLADGALKIGRDSHAGLALDARLSRDHVAISYDGAQWTVRDLDSRNGTFVDGVKVTGAITVTSPRVIRAAQTIVLPLSDGWAAETASSPAQGEMVIGIRLQRALAEIDRAAAAGGNALILGESGAGKELASRAFHAAGPNAKGPLVAVNCATIPHGLAERLLFGAKRGAFSGAATDSEGYAQSADGGVLFLDELGELELEVQAKLLRLLETKEVTPLGGTRAQKVDVRFCFATHRDLRAAVSAGRFRSDLYYRIAQPAITLPPLRERLEEIPWHLLAEVRPIGPALAVSAELVEECMLRPWPGNVRELRAEARRLAHATVGGPARTLRPEHLDPTAGVALAPPAPPGTPSSPPAPPEPEPEAPRREPVTLARLEAALREHKSPSAVARALGIHRSHLHRLLKQHGLERPGGD